MSITPTRTGDKFEIILTIKQNILFLQLKVVIVILRRHPTLCFCFSFFCQYEIELILMNLQIIAKIIQITNIFIIAVTLRTL